MHKIDVISMGCSKNLVDSEHLLYQLKDKGYEVYHNPITFHGDVVVVNTCGFIGDAKEESINMILQLVDLKKKGQLNKLFVMGCLSERYLKDLMTEIPEVDKYYGKFDWTALADDICDTNIKNENSKPLLKINNRLLTTPSHYAYIKIAEGCNRSCSYCAIPIITGRHKSRTIEDIVDEVKMLVKQGVKEFQIIAQELTYYGIDIYKKRTLTELIERISDINGVEWIRLHYAYPNSFPEDILRVMRERPNVCKYLDMALQHSSDKVLERMHRHITKSEQEELVKKIREEVPDICLRTTFMVGFPGETDEDFADLLDFTSRMRFDRMGAFSYSEEDDTFAALNYKDNVPAKIKEERLSELMRLQQTISEELCLEKVGKTFKTIIDRQEGEYYIGRTEYDSPEVDGEVFIPSTENLMIGHFYDIQMYDSNEFDLYGRKNTCQNS